MMRRHGDPKRRQGFTLLEVMLAITLLTLITSLVYTSMVPALETTEIVDSQRELYRRTRIIFGRMEDELRSSFLGNYDASHKRDCQIDERDCPYMFVGENNGDADDLVFTTLGGRPGSRILQSDQLWVHYYVERDSETKTDALVREESPVHTGDFKHDVLKRKYVLFPNVTKFDLRYVDRGTTNDFLEEWDSTRALNEKQEGNLPRAVEMTVVFTDEQDREIEFTSLVDVPGSAPYEEKAQ